MGNYLADDDDNDVFEMEQQTKKKLENFWEK